MTFEEAIKQDIKDGYINNEGAPLKCRKCGSSHITTGNEYYENYGVIEYDAICVDCGEVVGHWAYGYWNP